MSRCQPAIEATARDGNLTLTGAVPYGPQRTAAESAVAGLTGLRNIKDAIEIAYDAGPSDVSLLVQNALDRYALIPDDSDVAVDTHGNTVTLAGHVRTWAEHDAVIGAAWMASGGLRRPRRPLHHWLIRRPCSPGRRPGGIRCWPTDTVSFLLTLIGFSLAPKTARRAGA